MIAESVSARNGSWLVVVREGDVGMYCRFHGLEERALQSAIGVFGQLRCFTGSIDWQTSALEARRLVVEGAATMAAWRLS